MTNLKKYKNAFCESFQIEDSKLIGLSYQAIPTWDSVGHMGMISAIEECFDIMMETDDIIDFSSYTKGIELLEKYGVKI